MTKTALHTALAAALALTACDTRPNGAPADARPDADETTNPPAKTYKQIEHLARPGIAEALLLRNDFLAAYNATAPTFAGVDPAAVGMVAEEAKTVLRAVYLGACLLNGVLGLTTALGVKPAGATCVEVGAGLFTNNSLAGTELKPAVKAAADAYANRVFAQFVPDVMRIDMSIATSSYETLCGDPTASLPLLCGGRFLDDDTIDTTYDYLINGAASAQGAGATYTQFSALVSDGVNFQPVTAQNKNNRVPSDPTNEAQFHPAVSNTFPYSANPL